MVHDAWSMIYFGYDLQESVFVFGCPTRGFDSHPRGVRPTSPKDLCHSPRPTSSFQPGPSSEEGRPWHGFLDFQKLKTKKKLERP